MKRGVVIDSRLLDEVVEVMEVGPDALVVKADCLEQPVLVFAEGVHDHFEPRVGAGLVICAGAFDLRFEGQRVSRAQVVVLDEGLENFGHTLVGAGVMVDAGVRELLVVGDLGRLEKRREVVVYLRYDLGAELGDKP